MNLTQGTFGEIMDVPNLMKHLRDQAGEVQSGNMAIAEAMLMNQATALQSLFARLVERGMGKYRNQEDISLFIDNHHDLTSLLLNTSEKVLEFFPDHKLSLELIQDYDFDSEPHIALIIETPLSADEALEKLDNFDENWWIDAKFSSKEKVCIALEYI